MKRALIIAIIWLITSLWIIVGTVAYTLSQKDKVVFTEKVLYGEKSVVEGVTIERRCKYMDSVFWDSKYIVGETPQTTTKYKYYQLPHDELVRNDIFNVSASLTGGEAWIDSDDGLGFEILWKELKSEAGTAALETVERTVYLKDYMKYYYWDIGYSYNNDLVSLDWSRLSKGMIDKNGDFFEGFSEFFKIPVLENSQYSVYYKTDGQGDEYSRGYELVSGDEFQMYVKSIFVEDTCYFVFDAHTSGGNVVDTDLIPGGFGIYAFTFDKQNGIIDKDSLKCMYSLNPEDIIQTMYVDESEERLLLFTTEGEFNYMTVIDIETMEQVQRLAYGNSKLYNCWDYDDFMVLTCEENNVYVFSKDMVGQYQYEYAIHAQLSDNFQVNCALDWNGEQLLVAGMLENDRNCGMDLKVYDRNGLVFHAEYESSLTIGSGNAKDDKNKCIPVTNNPLEVSWN